MLLMFVRQSVCAVQKFIPGEHKKYNNNGIWVDDKIVHVLLMCC